MRETDVLVIGSEGAGARAAIAVAQLGAKVLVVSKGKSGHSGATITAGCDISCDARSLNRMLGKPDTEDDSPQKFFEDVISVGKGLNHQGVTMAYCEDVPDRVAEMLEWGMVPSTVLHVSGHRYARGLYASGKNLVNTLQRQARKVNAELQNYTVALDLIKVNGQVVGAFCLNMAEGRFEAIKAKVTILATGGGMAIYPVQTAAAELTGDGMAMAWRAGAELVDMEFVQFMPCCLMDPPGWRGHQFPYVLGPGAKDRLYAHLLNRSGERFMLKHDSEWVEKTTRDVLSRAIMQESRAGRGGPNGGVYFSVAHLPKNLIDHFATWAVKPSLTKDWVYQGLDFKSLIEFLKEGNAVEVGVGAHFFCGGIRINEWCETGIPGLLAAGEVSGGGHGANRASGNAATEFLVHGERSGRRAVQLLAEIGDLPWDDEVVAELEREWRKPLEATDGFSPFQCREEISQAAWNWAGALRDPLTMEKGLDQMSRMRTETVPTLHCKQKQLIYNPEYTEAIQVKNAATVLEAIFLGALARKESRGVHYREDAPLPSDQLCSYVIGSEKGQMTVGSAPITTLTPAQKG